MNIPSVNGYGSFNIESFDDYFKRWPIKETTIPKCLVENWVYRNWRDFKNYWLPIGALEWQYKKHIFDNNKILQILHSDDWIDTLDYWGDELFKNEIRQDTWLAKYMLSNGTTPAPILVFENGGNLVHPREPSGTKMCEPYQIIEGHMRTAYLRGMINNNYETLQPQHEVWVASIGT